MGAKSVGWFLGAMILCGLAGATTGAAQVAPTSRPAPAPSDNRYNDELLKLSPEQRAATLANRLGGTCIGTNPFFMGVTKAGPAKGYAYWSITCAGGQSYMIQISPDGIGGAVDCQTLKEGGEGRECYKTF